MTLFVRYVQPNLFGHCLWQVAFNFGKFCFLYFCFLTLAYHLLLTSISTPTLHIESMTHSIIHSFALSLYLVIDTLYPQKLLYHEQYIFVTQSQQRRFCMFSLLTMLSACLTFQYSLSLSLYHHSNFSTSFSLYNSIFTCVGTVQFLAVGQEIVKSRGFGGLYAGFKFKSLHLGGGGALMAFFLPFFKKIFSVSPSTSDK